MIERSAHVAEGRPPHRREEDLASSAREHEISVPERRMKNIGQLVGALYHLVRMKSKIGIVCNKQLDETGT